LRGAAEGSPESGRLDVLAMEQMGLIRKDLEPMTGTRARGC
jgi:hypothetical protein